MPIQQILLGAGGPAPEVVGQALLTGNNYGGGPLANQVTPVNWTVPANVTSISVLLIGPGAASVEGNSGNSGAGGSLAYANNIEVTPGASLEYITIIPTSANTYQTGWKSYLAGPASGSQAAWTITANGGNHRYSTTRTCTGNPGSVSSTTPPGGDGGTGGTTHALGWGIHLWPGGGGGGGYGASGGAGAQYSGSGAGNGALGSGGGASSGGGGGVGPYGDLGGGGSGGVSQSGGSNVNGACGQGDGYVSGLPGGTPTNNTDNSDATGAHGGDFGGGAGCCKIFDAAAGTPGSIPGGGCVRIIWPGDSRQFPSTRTTNE